MTDFNNTEVAIPDYLVQQLFEKQAALNPLKTAVSSGGISLTYRELDHQSNQLANHLVNLGVIPGNIVGVCIERSVDMVVSVLGALKAGCCYLPLDPSFPDERIKYMYEDSGAKVLISQNSLKKKFRQFPNTSIVLTDTDKRKIIKYSSEKPNLKISSQSLAYIIYTSGSTGTPKGVKVHHEAVVNLIESMSEKPGIKEDDILLAVITLSFDMSVFELFVPLSKGATVVVANSQDTADGQALIYLIDKYNITILQATPSLWNILLANGWKGKNDLKALCGGEALTKNMVRQILPKVAEFWNCYGPTETTVYSTCSQVTDPDAPILIGRPINNTGIHILDKNNKLLPVGVTGEVCIGGLGVTKGYNNLPELTEEKFIPFENGQIIYKTGDLGRLLADGNIELFGRIDNQIKLRGFRIEPGEIESLLSRLPRVKEAVVKVHKFEENDERLVAFLNVDTEFKLTKEEIKGSISQHLPAYMIPSFFQVSDGFPKLPNGKINKKALLFEMQESEAKNDLDFDSLTSTQKKLISIWEGILKIKNISPSYNFFEIGGNSLLTIRILNKIREEVGFTMTFKSFVAYPTIIQSANYIDSQSQISDKAIGLIHLAETTILPLTLNQKRLWLISKLQPDLLSYIIPYTCQLFGALNRAIFQKSIDILFRRHHIVFSVIKEQNGEPYCDIVPSKVDISFIDYSGLPENERSEKVDDVLNADSGKAFDLQNGPLYRLYLIMTGADEYYFHISIHHIIFDDWSWSVLVNDLNEIYNSLLNGEEVGLEKIEFQQYDYAYWEKNSANFSNNHELIEFWKENLKGASQILNFPYDFQRGEKPSGRGSYETIQLSQELSAKLRRISKTEGSSLFTTMLSVFGVQMQKYSGEDDINFGLPVAYRPHSMLENIFGMFVNTVVVRLRYAKEFTFRDIIRHTGEAALNAIAHQELPFENIVEIVNPERSPDVNPLFQISFVWQHNLNMPIKLEGIRSEKISNKERATPFDISLYLWENEEIIEGEIEYSTDLLKYETILRLKNNFLSLLNNLVENPDAVVESLAIISDEEKIMIDGLNETRTNYPKDKTIACLFEDQAILYQDKAAVVFKGESLTYKQLNEKANRLARTLRDMGVKSDTPVGIFTDKSVEMIVGMLGILKAGGAYLPIDPEYPIQRVNFIIKESGCKVLLTQQKYMEVPVEEAVKLDLNSPVTYHEEKGNPVSINSSSDLAYYIYTSGTTGVPKGSMIRHYSVVRLVRNVNYMDLRPDDRILYTSALVFDVTTFEIWGALLNGMTLYVVEKETILDASALGEELIKNEITILHLTSALFTQLAEARTDIFAGLKYLLVGGDVLSVPHINKVRYDNPQLRVINCYGPSENTTYSTTYLIDKTYDLNIPIGKPVSNSTVFIFDKHLNYQPIGVFGELYVGGDGLSKGYLNRDDLNSTGFVIHPNIPEERLYKTGDFGRWLADGNIEFHGRVDNQLKIRGFRVELEEIESVISKIEGVIETVIKAVKVEDGDYKLIAFLNVPETFKMDVKEISRRVKEKLPAYMVPSAYRLMQGFPKTINGKTDKKALTFEISGLESKNRQEKGDFTSTGRKIHKIWCEALKSNDISTEDNFFDIGGNSLLTIRIINKIKEELGVTLTFKSFIAHPTIIQSGEYIDSQTQIVSNKAIELVHLTQTTNLPLTLNQKRLWLISKLQPDIPSYIIPFTYKLSGSLDREIFQKSLEILFRQHHIVFSVIKEADDEPYCDIVPSEVDISIIDYSGLPENEKPGKVNEILNADSVKIFDLENGPLYRLYLIMTGAEEYYFRISIHHIIFDGWSWGVLVKDLNEIYNSLLRGKEFVPDKIEFQQYDYAQWEKNSAGSNHEEESKKFWKENLTDASPILNFPYDFQRTDEPSGRGGYVPFALSQDLSEKLRRISKSEGSSLFATMLSVFGIQMQKYSGEDDINIGLPVAYRPHSKLENIFGMFVNTVVVRLRYAKELSFRNIIHLASEAALNAIAHQDLPFEKVVEIVNPERSSNVNPLFQIAFVWQNNLDEPMKLEGIRVERITGKEGTSIFDISMYLWENENHIEGEIEYNLDILKSDTIIRLRDSFVHLLQSVVENPDQAISEISLISENDKKMLSEFNNTEVAIPDCLVQNFFEKQAGLTPLKTAIISGTSGLSYKELNEKSNQLARHLISLGVTAGDVVGICIERSVNMVVSVLGVLKAGCCYLPMDPSFPDERISYMYEDSGAKVLISQSSLKEKFSQFLNTSIVLTDTDKNKISKYSTGKPDLDIDTQSLAYIIYTSGSTGKPKGVKVHHQAVVNFLNSMSKKPCFSNEERLLAVTTLSFDISVLELFLPLSFGAELIIADTEDVFDGQKLTELLDLNDITVMQATPATWNILLGSGWKGKKNMKALCGGEAILPGLVKDLLPKVESLWDMYGPTETTVWSTCNQLTDSKLPILVGTPIDNTTVYILDKYNNQLPVGVTGEVCIGGLGVTKGYNNLPELTAEKFIPFENGQTIYKTGDLGRFLTDGNIELFGRIDNQIKLRGFRIEPGEIESLLSGLSGVIEAVVRVHKFDENDERLVAFLNIDRQFKLTDDEISVSLSQNLPGYMIPSFFRKSEGFPRLPNGKINKKALILESDESGKPQEIDPDSLTPTQKKLIHIWEDILKTKNVTSLKSFFDIGGNSLLAIRLLNKIKEELGFTLSFKTFLASPTVIQSANYIDSHSQSADKAMELVHLTQTTNLPLTLNQKRLWLISVLQPDIPSYIIPFTYKLSGSLDREIFQKSLEILFHRHHTIFSVIKEVKGEPYCDIVLSEVDISIIDYSGLPENEKSGKVNEVLNADSVKIFDLENGPLYRLYLIMTGAEEYYFRISIHHIIFDGWSWGVLVKDLNEIYNSLLRGKEFVPDKIEFQQYDYAQWEKNSEGSKHEEESKKFWKENLTDASSILNFPYDFKRTDKPSGRGGYVPFALSQDLSEKLRRISKSEGSSLFATMLSVFGIQMQKYSGEDDINIGLPVAYRPHSKLENIFGMFVNTVVVRLRYAKESSFRNIIHLASEAALNAIAHQDLPFEKLVEIVNPERSSNVNPLFQVAFAWQNNLDEPLKLEGIRVERITGKERNSIFDITFYMWENGRNIEGEFEYNIDMLRHDTIIRFRNNFLNLVNNLVENSDTAIESLSMISDEEKKIIDAVNDTLTTYSKDKTILRLFEERVTLDPERIAIVFDDSELTYSELDIKANLLAGVLQTYSIGSGDFVGLLINPSPELIICLLAIFKTGAAYVPLNLTDPENRVMSIIDAADIKFVITNVGHDINLTGNRKLLNIEQLIYYSGDFHGKYENIGLKSTDPAYIIFTSGTTGTPKGVLVNHKSVINIIEWVNRTFEISNADKLLWITNLSFDLSVYDIFGILAAGGIIRILSDDDRQDAKKQYKILLNEGITFWDSAPQSLQQLTPFFNRKGNPGLFNSLRLVFLSGDWIPLSLPLTVTSVFSSAVVVGLGGATEATIWSNYFIINKILPEWKSVPYGKPIQNVRYYILDEKMDHCRIQQPGNLYIGGECLALGYYNDPVLTNSKFIADPYNPGSRLYLTGDKAQWMADGNIEFLGREDEQIKVRGYRVEIGEIKNVVLQNNAIKDAIVIPDKSDRHNIKVILFITAFDNRKLDLKDLRREFRGCLPEYMIPADIIQCSEFPVTSNGKIDTKKLLSEYLKSFNDHQKKKLSVRYGDVVKTLTKTELKIYNIWVEALKIPEISVTDNFFDVGGNSLLAISVFSKIETAFNVEPGLRIFFDSPRIKDLAEAIDISIHKNVEQKSFEKTEGEDVRIIKGEI